MILHHVDADANHAANRRARQSEEGAMGRAKESRTEAIGSDKRVTLVLRKQTVEITQ